MAGALAGTSWAAIAGAAVFIAAAIAGLAFTLVKLEVGKTARRRRRVRAALERAERGRAVERATERAASNRSGLTPEEARRLEEFRPRARLMAGEPDHPLGFVARLRRLWREGYAGWIIASGVGAFSMATHFGAYWLIAGGGWLGAIVITVLSTLVMVLICFWLVLGLAESR
jgi:Flp pilus assembly protein TadB